MMKIKACAFLVVAFLSNYSFANSSWYMVNNYEGKIGAYSVHLSLQSYDFGDNVNVEGSYYYDKHRSPIVLYGKETKDRIELCEVNDKKTFDEYIMSGQHYDATKCPFQVSKTGNNITGVWQNDKVKLDVTLSKTSELDKSNISGGKIEIPFWGQTENHSFIGVYESGTDGIVINKVKVINKKDGGVLQVINPQLNNCDFGFYMTPIYQNIEVLNKSTMSLNCYSTNSDITVEYGLKNGKYLQIKQ